MWRTLELAYDKLIIGSDLSALSYSYVNKIPIFWLRKNKPHMFSPHASLYNDILLILSMNGSIPIGDNLYSLRLEDNKLRGTTKNNLVIDIQFNELIISDDYKLEGLSYLPISKTSSKYEVLDWFEINSGTINDLKLITGEDEFVKNIHFYKSDRFSFYADKKDCCSISVIEEESLNKFEFSQTYSSFKTKKMMSDYGIKGRYDKTANSHKLIKLTSIKREIFELGKNVYSDLPDNIKILYDTPEQIFSDRKNNISLLEEKLGINI